MDELENIKKEPYKYIGDFMEENLIHVGKKAFSIISLMPCSLILPNIPFGSSDIRSNINLMFIAPPSSGKSTLCKKYENFTFFPLKRRVISAPELSLKATEMKMLSLIIEDFSGTAEDYETVKVMEGIMGEEQNVSKSNMRMQLLGEVKGSGLLMGTPQDLERYTKSIEAGLLSRCMIMYIFHTAKQHSEIGEFINSKIGERTYSDEIKVKEDAIIAYYKELLKIQSNEHPIIKPITDYKIPQEFKKKISHNWSRISERLISEMGDKYWIRDLQEAYRLLVASAFLNVFNRKVENGILEPNEDDLKLALKLMADNMQAKWAIMKAIQVNRSIKNTDILSNYLNMGIPEPVKNILVNISPYAKILKDKDKLGF